MIVVTISSFIRSVYWCITGFSVNWLLVHSGLYHLWLSMPEKMQPDSLVVWSGNQVKTMKRKVKKQVGQETIRVLEGKGGRRAADSDAQTERSSPPSYRSDAPNSRSVPTALQGQPGATSYKQEGPKRTKGLFMDDWTIVPGSITGILVIKPFVIFCGYCTSVLHTKRLG